MEGLNLWVVGGMVDEDVSLYGACPTGPPSAGKLRLTLGGGGVLVQGRNS